MSEFKVAPAPATHKPSLTTGTCSLPTTTSRPLLSTDPSTQIDQIIARHPGWRGEALARMRDLIRKADPDVVEEIKWRKPSNPDGVPVWEHDGIICTGEIYKDKVKLTFNQGAALDDPTGLFNSSLGGKQRRALDITEGSPVDADAFVALIREAVAFNSGSN